jgi:hypothetical protein
MAALSDYAEKLALDFLMNTQTATRPTAWYIALFTAAPSDSGGGTEVSGNGYSRQAVTFGAAHATAGTTDNTNAQSFTASGGNWGTITHLGIFSASSSGNLIFHGALTTSRVVNDGDTLTFSIGNIDLTLG